MTFQGTENLGLWHRKAGDSSLRALTRCFYRVPECLVVP